MPDPIRFILNDREITTALPAGTTVLDFIRHQQRLVGTKIGCREGDCGACTILVGSCREEPLRYRSMTSCLMPLGNAHGKHLVTIEGLNRDALTPVQAAIVAEGGTQCGFCTVGFVVSLTGFCLDNRQPTSANAIASIDGNICRCTGYKSLERAAERIRRQLVHRNQSQPLTWLVEQGFLPEYFSEMPARLASLNKQLVAGTKIATGSQVAIGGGTDLLVQKPEQIESAELNLVFEQPGMNEIRMVDHQCRIGAATSTEDLRSSPLLNQLFPKLRSYMDLISSTPIRHMASVGGNLVNASPIGDLSIFFLALDAHISLRSDQGARQLPLKDFFLDYKVLAKDPGEILETVYFLPPDQNTRFHFEKVSKRTHLDIASVNSAMRISISGGKITHATIAAGGVAPIPKYLAKTSAALIGQPLTEATIHQALSKLDQEIAPISDIRGSAAYKRLLLKQQILAHFLTLFPQNFDWEALV